jgi:integral membrane protein
MPTTTKLNRFLKIGFAEGVSFILLIGIAMPLKYAAGILQPVRIVGMLHGILFILFGLSLLQAAIGYKWSFGKTTAAFLLSFIPFGTFFLEKLLKEEIVGIHSKEKE